MDTKKDGMIPQCGAFGTHRLIVGAKQIRKALEKGTVRAVFLAKNADPSITEPLRLTCDLHQIPYTWVAAMDDLGKMCGIDVGAAAAAATD